MWSSELADRRSGHCGSKEALTATGTRRVLKPSSCSRVRLEAPPRGDAHGRLAMERSYEIVDTDAGPVYRVRVRGTQVMREPHISRGTAFDLEERAALGLVGLLPQGVSTIDGQTKRVYAQYLRARDDLAKNGYLTALRDRNEVLFYRLLSEHMEEMLPIIYTPTIGQAIQRYSHEYRRPRGVFLSIDHQDLIEESLRNFGRSPDE